MNFKASLFSITLGIAGWTVPMLAQDNGGKPLDLTLLPPASTQAGVTYETDIKPLLATSCFPCHGEDKQKGQIRLDSLEAILKGGEDGKIVIPGDSAHSQLVIAVARIDRRSAMPPMRKPKMGPGGPPPAGGPPEGPKPPTAGDAGNPSAGSAPAAPQHMTPPGALTPEQVGLVRAWIDQGAK